MSDTARMLDDAAARLLERHADDPGLLGAAREAGLTLALAPEEGGGIGCTWSEAAVIAFRWGRHAAPLPIVEMLLAGRLAGLVGEPDLAERATVAHTEGGNAELPVFEGCDRAFVLSPTEGVVRIAGIEGSAFSEPTQPPSFRPERSGEPEPRGGGTEVPHREVPGSASRPRNDGETRWSLAGEPFVRISIDNATDSHPIGPAADEMVAGGGLLYSAAMVGAMAAVLEIAIEHANTRVQFGRPLGKFQAIQNLLADAAAEKAVTEAAVRSALRSLDEGRAAPIDWLSAKAQAGRAATVVAANIHQLLGAIGFTDEHRLHRYTKRLWAWRDHWLRQSACEAAVGRLACAAGGGGLWSLIADRPAATA